ncbi:hypothetical protein [Deinococcus yavapaiensis]|uniref:Uncharacterized protein n=1 Tax=Deinococcus yavapaiensis KR-236 TaxID=694435 RepID=A0A318S4Z9_9DEIO|nr:hypothetical protein [Deinococcus yavapaiensis]PYE53754.1 hypothetical protein DES52_10712 [Deinococcus yavapaiensis KR-236]
MTTSPRHVASETDLSTAFFDDLFEHALVDPDLSHREKTSHYTLGTVNERSRSGGAPRRLLTSTLPCPPTLCAPSGARRGDRGGRRRAFRLGDAGRVIALPSCRSYNMIVAA